MIVTFVNHASFVVSCGTVELLSDPWLTGRVFDDGWDLLVRSVHGADDFSDVTHLWISHEHPDHFHPMTLRVVIGALPQPPTLFFRPTADGRVVEWAKQHGFTAVEPEPLTWTELGPSVSFSISPFSTLDSWSAMRAKGGTILNLNDCAMSDPAEIARIRDHVGAVDLLVTQFGPAAWLGNPDDPDGRQRRARESLDRLERQIELLEPTWVLPAGSFIRNCHEENAFMNENRVGIAEAVDTIRSAGASPVVLRPGDTWSVGTDHDPTMAVDWYGERSDFSRYELLTSESVSLDEILHLGSELAARNRGRNNRVLMAALVRARSRRLKPVTVRLWDLESVVRFSPTAGLESADIEAEPDVAMHSSSLAYVLRFDWGLDTLLINGRFTTRTGAESDLTAAFWLGPWNCSGNRLGLGMVIDAARRRLARMGPVRRGTG